MKGEVSVSLCWDSGGGWQVCHCVVEVKGEDECVTVLG